MYKIYILYMPTQPYQIQLFGVWYSSHPVAVRTGCIYKVWCMNTGHIATRRGKYDPEYGYYSILSCTCEIVYEHRTHCDT